MFRITEDPSSGSLVQCLAKIYKSDSIVCVDMDRVCVMAAYCDRLCVRVCACVQFTVYEGTAFINSELHTRTHNRSQYAAITPILSVSTDTTESFL